MGTEEWVRAREEAKSHKEDMNQKYSKEIEKSIKHTQILYPRRIKETDERICQVFSFIQSKPEEAIFDYAMSGTITVLNPASYMTPAGTYIVGGESQENDLCKTGTLYNILSSKNIVDNYYQTHGVTSVNSGMYGDDILWIPEVIFENDDYIIKSNVISCSPIDRNYAVNKCGESEEAVDQAMRSRIKQIMDAFVEHPTDSLVLHAFGCDDRYGNEAKLVMNIFFDEIMSRVIPANDIVFCIPKGETGEEIKAAFNQRFTSLG